MLRFLRKVVAIVESDQESSVLPTNENQTPRIIKKTKKQKVRREEKYVRKRKKVVRDDGTQIRKMTSLQVYISFIFPSTVHVTMDPEL